MTENPKQKVERFLGRFPVDATGWDQATDELPDLHNLLAQELPGYRGNVWVTHGGRMPVEILKSPAARNQYHREAIRQLLETLPQKALAKAAKHFAL